MLPLLPSTCFPYTTLFRSEAAIGLMLSLVERAKGKPFEHFRAGAHHDLVHLKLSQGDIPGAQQHFDAARALCKGNRFPDVEDRKSTRLNSSHITISYAVFC